MNTMTYKDFFASIEFVEDDDIFVGRVLGLPQHVMISFEGDSVETLREDFHHAIDFYLQDCAEHQETPDHSVIEAMVLHVPSEVRLATQNAARAARQNLDQWAAKALTEAARIQDVVQG